MVEKYGVRDGEPRIYVGRIEWETPDENPQTKFYCCETDAATGDFSSTLVRKALAREDQNLLIELVNPSTAEYLISLPRTSWDEF